MPNVPYRFEKYGVPDFPVYASSPNSGHHIVTAHYHRDAEIIKVLKGKIEIHVDTSTYDMQEGELIFYSPYIVHEVIAKSNDAKIQGFVFDTKLLDNLVDFTIARNTHLLFSADSQKLNEISKLFDELHKVYKERPDTFKLRISAGLLHLAAILTETGFLPPVCDCAKQLRTAPVVKYIQKNYSTPLTISELALQINLCNDSFIRLFKKEHGQTPFSFIINFRITEALRLLSDSRYSISEIAILTGFASQAYFTKTFTQKLGISPQKYRKKHFLNNAKTM